MSHDMGGSNAKANRTWTTNQKTNAGRPSLFGNVDADVSDRPERVRILSTLNAQKPPSKRAKTRTSWTRQSSPDNKTSSKALWITMTLGICGLVLGVVLSWQDSSALKKQAIPSLKSPAQADLRQTDSAPDVARIEDMPSNTNNLSLANEIGDQIAVPRMLMTEPTPVATAAMQVASQPISPQHATLPKKAAITPALKKANSNRDADVALIEAMFVHTKTPAKQRVSQP